MVGDVHVPNCGTEWHQSPPSRTPSGLPEQTPPLPPSLLFDAWWITVRCRGQPSRWRQQVSCGDVSRGFTLARCPRGCAACPPTTAALLFFTAYAQVALWRLQMVLDNVADRNNSRDAWFQMWAIVGPWKLEASSDPGPPFRADVPFGVRDGVEGNEPTWTRPITDLLARSVCMLN